MFKLSLSNKSSIKLFLIAFTVLFSPLAVRSQSVNGNFSQILYNDTFDNNNAEWPILTNNESFFIIQNGEYIINRTNKTPFVIFNNNAKEPERYSISTALKLEEKSTEKNGAGLIFMVQDNNKGAFILEIGINKQYRIMQIVGATFQLITGGKDNDGWIKSASLKPAGVYNNLVVNIGNKYADIYINGDYITTLTDQTYLPGKVGIIIEGGTKARADFFVLSIPKIAEQEVAEPIKKKTEIIEQIADEPKLLAPKDTVKAAGNTITDKTDAETETEDISVLATSLVKIKTQLNKSNKTIDSLKKQLQTPGKLASENKELTGAIKVLEKQVIDKNADIDSLKKENDKLKKYEKMILGNENADLVISLSKLLQNEKKQKEALLIKNKRLTDSINDLNKQPKPTIKKVVKESTVSASALRNDSLRRAKADTMHVSPVTETIKEEKQDITGSTPEAQPAADSLAKPALTDSADLKKAEPVKPKLKVKISKAKKEAAADSPLHNMDVKLKADTISPAVENNEIKLKTDSAVVPNMELKEPVKLNTDSVPSSNPK